MATIISRLVTNFTTKQIPNNQLRAKDMDLYNKTIYAGTSDETSDETSGETSGDDTEELPFLQELEALSTDSDWREEVEDIAEHVKEVWPFDGSPWLGKLLFTRYNLELVLSKCRRGYARPLRDMLTKTGKMPTSAAFGWSDSEED